MPNMVRKHLRCYNVLHVDFDVLFHVSAAEIAAEITTDLYRRKAATDKLMATIIARDNWW